MDTQARPPQVYVVLREVGADTWQVIGEVPRHPGLPARRSRAKAIEEALGRLPTGDERFAVLPRSEWRLAHDW
ncbi:hypothetical protein OWR29_30670 [Actinoplanes sp. Pm04-4]|uniref:Uncharacterized protein n=1 Tax=Paractinoplanes pyxinae TaxID=2997416 RepID=A0ABT4B7A0_9ACTN|nr:hypothetical protein [Actinoplanes pyxinae]MCY1142383.1 hypothetical protein [Actinoplanes pyxinae]